MVITDNEIADKKNEVEMLRLQIKERNAQEVLDRFKHESKPADVNTTLDHEMYARMIKGLREDVAGRDGYIDELKQTVMTRDGTIKYLKGVLDTREHEFEALEAELSARKEDSRTLMQVVEIINDEEIRNSDAAYQIAVIVKDYRDAPESPVVAENMSIDVYGCFATLKSIQEVTDAFCHNTYHGSAIGKICNIINDWSSYDEQVVTLKAPSIGIQVVHETDGVHIIDEDKTAAVRLLLSCDMWVLYTDEEVVEVKQQQQTIDELKHLHGQKDDTIISKNLQLMLKDVEIDRFREIIDDERNRVDERDRHIEKLAHEIVERKRNEDRHNDRIDRLTQEVTDRDAIISSLRKDRHEKQDTIDGLRHDSCKLNDRLERIEKHIDTNESKRNKP